MDMNDVKNDFYDPDNSYTDDNKDISREPSSALAQKNKTGTPKKKRKAKLDPEELDKLLLNMRAEAYCTDSKEVKAYRKAKGLTEYTKISATDHSEFLHQQRREQHSYPSYLVKNIQESRDLTQKDKNGGLDTELERLSGKAYYRREILSKRSSH